MIIKITVYCMIVHIASAFRFDKNIRSAADTTLPPSMGYRGKRLYKDCKHPNKATDGINSAKRIKVNPPSGPANAQMIS